MSRWWRRRRLRVNLTLWHVAAMVAVLAVYVVVVLAFVGRSASQNLDSRLRGDYTWAVEMWDQRPDGTLTWFDGDDGTDEDRPWLQVWDAESTLLYRTAVARRNPIPGAAELARDPDGRIVSVASNGPPYRVLSRAVTVGGRRVVIQVAKSEALMRHDLTQLLLYLLFGLPLGVGIAGVGGYLLARRALASVERMTDRARSITAARLNERLPVEDPDDELGRLATVFNETLERLDASFGQMRRFTSDVSHELRTPLAAIRTVGEVGLRERRSPDAYRAVIESMLEETDRLSSFVERLLLLSRAEGGQMPLTPERLDLGELVDEVVMQLGVLAEDKRQRIVVSQTVPSSAASDRLMLRQALTNLVDNAIKYGPDGSDIHIEVTSEADHAILEVTDAGTGIPPERRAGIFDRFVRGGDGTGWGLGLSIARWAVEANGGQLTYEPRSGGSTFRITLPTVG
jgi:heavy metal sensor kinase